MLEQRGHFEMFSISSRHLRMRTNKGLIGLELVFINVVIRGLVVVVGPVFNSVCHQDHRAGPNCLKPIVSECSLALSAPCDDLAWIL